jgi:exodeoxyribonuclease VII small subunit
MPQSKKSAGTKNFEDRLKRLEDLSALLKEGKISLEEAAKYFEEGISLARGLEKDLGKIERKIEILMNSPETEAEKPELELFPELDEDD